MKAVAKTLAEIRVEVETVEAARGGLQAVDRKQQKAALVDIAVSSMNAANKAEEIIAQIQSIRSKLERYQQDVAKA